MPGKYDSSNPAATFISAWAAYRSALTAADDPAHPEAVVPQIDLTKSFHGTDSIIRVFVKKTAGTGTVDVVLYLYSSGDLVTAVGWTTAATQTGMATGTYKEFTGLTAGIYVAEVANVTTGAHWDLYVATNWRCDWSSDRHSA